MPKAWKLNEFNLRPINIMSAQLYPTNHVTTGMTVHLLRLRVADLFDLLTHILYDSKQTLRSKQWTETQMVKT